MIQSIRQVSTKNMLQESDYVRTYWKTIVGLFICNTYVQLPLAENLFLLVSVVVPIRLIGLNVQNLRNYKHFITYFCIHV